MLPIKNVTALPDANTDFSICLYASDVAITRGRSMLRQNMVSLIMSGEKIIHLDDKPIHVKPDSILLLASGNYLYTERFPDTAALTSIIIYFDDLFLESLYKQSGTVLKKAANPKSYALFPKDGYLSDYISSLKTLLTAGSAIPQQLQRLKLQELFLYLITNQPILLAGFMAIRPKTPEYKIKQVLQENLMNGLTISELAFLCNMSLPSFKRKFTALYNTSPARWIQHRRLEAAAHLLFDKKARPADVYLMVGYENHSSFSQAFKEYYGILPKAYAGEKSRK